ncbi:hypothetical protein [uncultured Draconibacterium sp.]|uniref:hypothetical protein n=1 Tax=uncultured Draconibacterium sp. TaxID=1573823 RepID=UPI002AA8E81F|nr:hypothetical protein [uncultured Draconibacterium sp.]
MKTRFIVTITLLLGFTTAVIAQTLGDFTPKEDRGAYGPRKFPSKDVYIANFSVNFQLYNLRSASTKGGFANKMLSGDTKASLAVGLDIPASTLQQITDEAYQEFVAELKASGFNVLNPEAAAKTPYYENYERIDNMEMSLSEAPGVVTVYPSNTTFFVKGFNNSGKVKREGMFSVIGLADRQDEVMSYSKLSRDLNDATIVNADMYVLFLDVNKPYQGNGAKLTANTNLRLSAYDALTSRMASGKNSFTDKIGITASKNKEYTATARTAIDFVAGRNKIGGSALGTYTGVLKKDLTINGVVGQEKVQSYAKTQNSYLGVETAFGKMYRTEDISVENTALIKADAGKYENGVEQALQTFLKHHVGEFKDKFFKN